MTATIGQPERKKAWVYDRETSNRISTRPLTQTEIDAYRAQGHSVRVPGEDGIREIVLKSADEWTGRSVPLSKQMIEAFGDDQPYDEFCPGNSHALIVRDRSATTADCECGNALVLVDGRTHGSPSPVWVHGVNLNRLCPPYDCKCGQRHNLTSPATAGQRVDYVQAWTDINEELILATETQDRDVADAILSAMGAASAEASRLAEDADHQDDSFDPAWCEDAVKAYRRIRS